jgi:crotonobetainyl-CoA:carnitine CoA-transferase CaiB-like acyl-CoA transferase
VGIKAPAPLPGEHTGEILKDAGFSVTEIRKMKRQGII